MTKDKQVCEKPEKLDGKPEDCSPEQIRECHGNEEAHSCETLAVKPAEKKSCCCRP
jgi:hypothetical protein